MQIKFYDCDEKGRMQSTLHIMFNGKTITRKAQMEEKTMNAA